MSPTKKLSHADYTVGWICALSLEMASAIAMLDEKHESLSKMDEDDNGYVLGATEGHNVVIVCLPAGSMGSVPAATVAAGLKYTFTNVRYYLMVGIGGGVPSSDCDIRLGDVVVSKPTNTHGGVVQYDYGKSISNGVFQRTGSLNKPPPALLIGVSNLQANLTLGNSRIPDYLSDMRTRYPRLLNHGSTEDQLFQAGYTHNGAEKSCENCDKRMLVRRSAKDPNEVNVFYGVVGSANQVMRDGRMRDRLAGELGILCFEMEAAGLMDNFPCLVIRGICDYADSHKNKDWQQYAATTAAAYAKDLLWVVSGRGKRHATITKQTSPQEDTQSLHVLTPTEPPGVSEEIGTLNLETEFFRDHVRHFVADSRLGGFGRATMTEQRWQQQQELLGGRENKQVWLERCVQGQNTNSLRAVRKISKLSYVSKSRFMGYDRALEVIATVPRQQYDRWLAGVFGWFESASDLYIAMEYFPLGDLGTHLSHERTVSERESQTITAQILQGLQWLHLHRLPHGNLKPSKILFVSKPPDNWRIKLGDFGVPTRGNTLRGPEISETWGFVAPELRRLNPESCSLEDLLRADMWSLGEVVFKMLTGRPVFQTRAVLEDYVRGLQDFPNTALCAHRIDGDGINFITLVMRAAPKERLVVAQATCHPWLQAMHPDSHQTRSYPVRYKAPGRDLYRQVNDYVGAGRSNAIASSSHQTSTLTEEYTSSQHRNQCDDTDSHCILQGHMLSVTDVAISLDSKIIASASEDRSIRLWDILTGSRVAELNGHTDSVTAVEFSPSQLRVLVSASGDKTLRLWDTQSGTFKVLRAHTEAVRSVLFLPNGRVVASAARDMTIRLWDTTTGECLKTLRGHTNIVTRIAVSSDSTMIASASGDSSVRVWDVASGSLKCKLEDNMRWVASIAFSPNGDDLLSGSGDGVIRLWEISQGTVRNRSLDSRDSVRAVMFSRDGNIMASMSDHTIYLWDTRTFTLLRQLEGHGPLVLSVSFSPDDTTIVSSSIDRTVRLWDVATGRVLRVFTGHTAKITAIAIAPNGEIITSACQDKTVRLWDART